MKTDKWVKRWTVPSSSSKGVHIIGIDAEGNYGCSCPAWTRIVDKYCPICKNHLLKEPKNMCPHCFTVPDNPIVKRIECHHIKDVKAGMGKELKDAVMDRLLGV